MLLPGTQMHLITFLFICIEIVILFYLSVHRLARPDDKTSSLNIVLISLLIVYNVAGGLLPDENLPGTYFTQNILAYATGFITPCYFPYYVYNAFGLLKMKFHAYKGVYLFLLLPYLLFILVFAVSGDIETAKNLLILPVVYALWVVYTLLKAIKYKHNNNFNTKASKEELIGLSLSLSPWIAVPVIDYFNVGQAVEALVTNLGFLTLFAIQVKEHIKATRMEHEHLAESEKQLMNWNNVLQTEVEKRTKELATINEQQMNTFINLAHETKTPLTLVNNYMDDYIARNGSSEELKIVRSNLNKLSADIVNLFDLEKLKKGIEIYDNTHVCNFSQTLNETLPLFQLYAGKRNIILHYEIQDELHVKADPLAVNRIVNNLVENAIKYSPENSKIIVKLSGGVETIIFTVEDFGPGIPTHLQEKIFEPYFQIKSKKQNSAGMGLGLPIAKKVANRFRGDIHVASQPDKRPGTTVTVSFPKHTLVADEEPAISSTTDLIVENLWREATDESSFEKDRKTILIVEDNPAMLAYLARKLKHKYNIVSAINGNEALQKLAELSFVPDLIVTDIMMDKLDGYSLAEILFANPRYDYIPLIFLSAKSTAEDKLQGLKLGALDFIQKPFNTSELLQKIETILSQAEKHQKALVKSMAKNLQLNNAQPIEPNGEGTAISYSQYSLSLRERDIAKLVCKGMQYAAIAAALFISEKTVAKHVQNIFKKVDVSNRIELTKKLHC